MKSYKFGIFFVAVILTSPQFSEAAQRNIPLKESTNWKALQYKNIPPTEYLFEDGSILVSVKSSASPLVFAFDKPELVTKVNLRARLEVAPTADLKSAQSDDFIIRYGLARSGQRRLNLFERALAPEWILTLNSMATKLGVGLGRLDLRVVFFGTAPEWSSREHPQSDLIYEHKGPTLVSSGPFEDSFRVEESKDASTGLWISADGDATKSAFTVRILELTIEGENL